MGISTEPPQQAFVEANSKKQENLPDEMQLIKEEK